MEAEVFAEMAGLQDRHWWFVGRRRALSAIIKSLRMRRGSEIVELGCGTGGNLKMLACLGNLQAMEDDAYARKCAESLGICRVHAGLLPSAKAFEGREFDLVCLLDVLEHIEDDVSALVSASKLLSANGKVLITAPAYQLLWSSHDDMHHHFRRYNQRSMRELIERSGLEVVRIGYFNCFLFAFVALVRFAKRLLGDKSSDVRVPGNLLNGILAFVFSLERHFVGQRLFPFGTSVVAVASKPRTTPSCP